MLHELWRRLLFLLLLGSPVGIHLSADAQHSFVPVPPEVASHRFIVSVNGKSTPILHAANGYYLSNVDLAEPAEITVLASDPHFWDRGVEVQPMRLGIRPQRDGATIRFRLGGPAKISIIRPGEHFRRL